MPGPIRFGRSRERSIDAARNGVLRAYRGCAGAVGGCCRRAHALNALIEQHAGANGLPIALVRHVIRRESNFNPRAVYQGNDGLMQIRLGTARALGYRGTAEGLLDSETNMTYGMRYLAGAYAAAHGNEARTLILYSSGYYSRGH
jgi:soluble lytic murein transglycosylase-like protein